MLPRKLWAHWSKWSLNVFFNFFFWRINCDSDFSKHIAGYAIAWIEDCNELIWCRNFCNIWHSSFWSWDRYEWDKWLTTCCANDAVADFYVLEYPEIVLFGPDGMGIFVAQFQLKFTRLFCAHFNATSRMMQWRKSHRVTLTPSQCFTFLYFRRFLIKLLLFVATARRSSRRCNWDSKNF